MTVKRADVIDAVRTIARYLSRPVSVDAAERYADEIMRACPESGVFTDALAHWMRTHGATAAMPSVTDLLTAIREEQAKRTRAAGRQLGFDAIAKSDSAIARDTAELVKRRIRGAIAHEQYLVELRGMHAKYPHARFDQAARALEAQVASDRRARARAAEIKRQVEETHEAVAAAMADAPPQET